MLECNCPTVRHMHGENRTYCAHKCRCFYCRVAHAAAISAHRQGARWVESTPDRIVGVRRRLQALAVIGYSAAAVGRVIDISERTVTGMRSDNGSRCVGQLTALRVKEFYDQHWDKPVTTADGRRCMSMVKRNKWVPPLMWDDDGIDDPDAAPAVRGSTAVGCQRDRYLELIDLGCTHSEIALKYRVDVESVVRTLRRAEVAA